MRKSRGRPTKNINWPEGKFTPKDVLEYNDSKVSTGLVHLKIKKALQDGSIKQVGQTKKQKGRPASLYSKKDDYNFTD